MDKEIIVKKDSIVIPCPDTVTIPRGEYNRLIIAKAQIDMILATAGENGYGCAEIVVGARHLDDFSKALASATERYNDLKRESDEAVAQLSKELDALRKNLSPDAEDTPDA